MKRRILGLFRPFVLIQGGTVPIRLSFDPINLRSVNQSPDVNIGRLTTTGSDHLFRDWFVCVGGTSLNNKYDVSTEVLHGPESDGDAVRLENLTPLQVHSSVL